MEYRLQIGQKLPWIRKGFTFFGHFCTHCLVTPRYTETAVFLLVIGLFTMAVSGTGDPHSTPTSTRGSRDHGNRTFFSFTYLIFFLLQVSMLLWCNTSAWWQCFWQLWWQWWSWRFWPPSHSLPSTMTQQCTQTQMPCWRRHSRGNCKYTKINLTLGYLW